MYLVYENRSRLIYPLAWIVARKAALIEGGKISVRVDKTGSPVTSSDSSNEDIVSELLKQ
jgi:hypothetical protein